jgi:hypothetical protein
MSLHVGHQLVKPFRCAQVGKDAFHDGSVQQIAAHPALTGSANLGSVAVRSG